MKLHILRDPKIKYADMEEVERQFIDLMYEHADITPTFTHEDKDYETYPKERDSDGDDHLPYSYLKEAAAGVYKKRGMTTDYVVLWIHRDNWELNGIWGTAYANKFEGYQVLVCRFDSRNLANSLGTLYHEVMHPFDTFIKTYTGVDINSLGKWTSWDKTIVHGGRPDQVGKYPWTYIRHKENTDALAYIAPQLREAFKKRHALYTQKTLISVLERIVVAYRALINSKSTVTK